MNVFAVNTIVHRDHQPVAFIIGDVVPDWAESLVGEHCLAAPAEPAAPSDIEDAPNFVLDAEAGDFNAADTPVEDEPAEATAVDFTKPATRATPRKK